MEAKKIIIETYKREHSIPTRKEITDFAKREWLEFFNKWEYAFMSSDKISLILNLDTNNPGEILEYLIEDWNWNTHKIEESKTDKKSRIKWYIDTDNKEQLLRKNIREIKLMVTSNSVYDDVIAIIDWEKINITDWDLV